MTAAPTLATDERERLLDAAEDLFYAYGVQAVGMDAIRAASGLPLKRIYQLYPSKDQLLLAFLDRRDQRWRGSLAAHVARVPRPEQQVIAVFDWLGEWFASPGFRGCAWINTFAELGATNPAVAQAVRKHKKAFRDYLAGLLRAAGHPGSATAGIFLLAEGAMTAAAVQATPAPARQARRAAVLLLNASRAPGT